MSIRPWRRISGIRAAVARNGDVQVELDNECQIPHAMDLVGQAFAGKQPGGAADSPGDAPAS